MADENNMERPGDTRSDLEGMEAAMEQIERLWELDPSLLTPDKIEEALGDVKLGEVMAQFQSEARKLAEQFSEETDEFDDDDDFCGAQEGFDSSALDQTLFQRPAAADGSFDDYPGSEELWQHAMRLNPEDRLHVTIEITSPPMSRLEKLYYNTCHYMLIFDPFDTKVTYRDVTTPRQDYLEGHGWPAMLRLPRKSWPQLEPLWDTVRVEQFNLREAMRTNDHERIARDDLVSPATEALRVALSR